MILYLAVALFVFHYIADYLLQPEWMAMNKSKDNLVLLSHTLRYTMIQAIPLLGGMVFIGYTWAVVSACMTFILVTHTVTDYFTSRATGKAYVAGKFYGSKGFFSILGFDQLCHQLQLVACLIMIDRWNS